MERRTQKQLVIGLITLFIVSAMGYGFVDYFFFVETTCFDSVQNGLEKGVDCGLLACGIECEPAILPLNILSQKFIKVRSNDYDFVAQINNPNSFFGASVIKYKLNLTEMSGDISNKSGTFYIFPGQTRFVIISGIKSDHELTSISIDITEVEWKKIQSFENINFSVQRKNYVVVNKNGTFSELEAVVLSNSDFDFDKVEVGVILFNDSNDIIAVNKTDIRTFLSRTERYFKVSWPVELSFANGQDIEVLTNVFENSNFLKKYGTQERFQLYY